MMIDAVTNIAILSCYHILNAVNDLKGAFDEFFLVP
jgi:hypothetical protein